MDFRVRAFRLRPQQIAADRGVEQERVLRDVGELLAMSCEPWSRELAAVRIDRACARGKKTRRQI